MPADKRFKAAIGAQAYTRTLPADLIASVPVPVLLLVGLGDITTSPATDAEPAWEILSKSSLPHRRLNLPYGGHQACSDFALYIELAPVRSCRAQEPIAKRLVRHFPFPIE